MCLLALLAIGGISYILYTQNAARTAVYEEANQLLKQGKRDEAYSAFLTIQGFKDVDSIISSIRSQKKAEIQSQYGVGKTVVFGTYNDEPIEWIVLDRNDDRALLLSKNALFMYSIADGYYSWGFSYSWSSSYFRTELNGSFFNKSFSENEKAQICFTTVKINEKFKRYTVTGDDTLDRLFLLSADEMWKYFPKDSDRKCYILLNNRLTLCDWWLRSASSLPYDRPLAVNDDGDVYTDLSKEARDKGIRPAMWIELKYD